MSFLRRILFYFWYWRQPPWDTEITPPEVYDFLDQNPPGRALDLGCGTGTNAITLAQRDWQVTGVDFVAKPIRAARKKAREAHVKVDFRVGDVTQLTDIKGSFDLILDIGCYQSLTSKGMEAYRSNVTRLLNQGGSFKLYVFFREANSDSGIGVTEADLEAFSPSLKLSSRQNGFERGTLQSAWLTYTKSGNR